MPDLEKQPEGRISFLNVGTKILLKDVMDQFLRTLGDFKTYYAPTMQSALKSFEKHTIHVLITEVDLEDGSAYRLIQSLGGILNGAGEEDLYVILALEDKSDELYSLAEEIEAHSVMVKPFNAADLKAQIERYKAWKSMPKEPWRLLVREAQLAAKQKKFREAEANYKDAIASAPDNPVPIYKAGMYYLNKPDYTLAENLFKKALALNSTFVQAVTALGQLYLIRKDLDRADECLKQAHQISPLNPDRLVDMVRLYIERCMDACKGSLRIDPANTAARFNLGKLMAVQKDYIGAVRELERALPHLRDDAKNEAQTYVALARKLGSLAK